MKSKLAPLLLLILVLCLTACDLEAGKQVSWDTKPGIIMNSMTYYADGGDVVDVLPEGFVYTGDVTEEIAGDLTNLIGCKIYRSENHAGYYIYQPMDWKDGQWGYVRYIH